MIAAPFRRHAFSDCASALRSAAGSTHKAGQAEVELLPHGSMAGTVPHRRIATAWTHDRKQTPKQRGILREHG
jgi:hypothetical protein